MPARPGRISRAPPIPCAGLRELPELVRNSLPGQGSSYAERVSGLSSPPNHQLRLFLASDEIPICFLSTGFTPATNHHRPGDRLVQQPPVV